MHQTYYNLRADPFRLSPDPRFCFPHRTYRKAMAYMRHALLRAEGFIIITGQPGMGKTTLINDLFRGLSTDRLNIARLVSTQLLADDLLRLMAYEFNLDAAGLDKASVLNRVGDFLKQQHREGRRTLLIVDEAQDVTGEALEELRLLTNIQVDGQQLLQIFLVGQEELRDAVSAPTLVQLHQRVIAATHLDPLCITETKEYIKHRLRRVGWEGNPLISNQVYAMIHQFSGGIPRQINQICSRLLLHGSIEERNRLGLKDLKIVIEELHGEMLLPLGMQEIAETVLWPAEQQQETYDEMRSSQPDVGPAASTARPMTAAAGNQHDNHDRPVPAAIGARRTDTQVHKRGPLRALVISVMFAGLLLALLLMLNTETGSRLRDTLATLTDTGNQKQPPASALSAPGPAAATGQQANTEASIREPEAAIREPEAAIREPEAAIREPEAAIREPEASIREPEASIREPEASIREPEAVSREPEAAIREPEASIREPEAAIREPEAATHDKAADQSAPVKPAPQPAETEDTATADPIEIKVATKEPAMRELPLSRLETDLAGNDLLFERLEESSLKINLSSAGIFEFNSTEISDSASSALDRLASVLRKHGQTSLHIVGHTDSSGDAGFNLTLSQVRAKAVADYLVNQGLPEERIQSEGRGDRDTRLEDATRDQPNLRRRVEIYLRPSQEE